MQIITKRWVQVIMTLFALTLSLFVAGCGGKTDATFNIAGGWSLFRVTTPADEQKDYFVFTTSNNDVGGTTTPGSGSASETITGTVSGNDVSFTTTVSGGVTRNYSGKLGSDGAVMSGTWTSTNPTASGTWSAVVRGIPLYNISGSWALTGPVGGIGGSEGFSFTMETTNDLTGSTTPPANPPVTITGTEGALDMIFFWKDNNGVFFTLIGKISGGTSMSGTWTSSDPNNASGTWSAAKNSI